MNQEENAPEQKQSEEQIALALQRAAEIQKWLEQNLSVDPERMREPFTI